MSGIINALVALWRASGMAFAFDGATFTPGEFVADSGSRTVEIELTLESAAITSGTLGTIIQAAGDDTLNGDTAPKQFSIDAYAITIDEGLEDSVRYVVIPAADGHCKVTATLENFDAEAADQYLIALLPTGAVAVSDAISVPGVAVGD